MPDIAAVVGPGGVHVGHAAAVVPRGLLWQTSASTRPRAPQFSGHLDSLMTVSSHQRITKSRLKRRAFVDLYSERSLGNVDNGFAWFVGIFLSVNFALLWKVTCATRAKTRRLKAKLVVQDLKSRAGEAQQQNDPEVIREFSEAKAALSEAERDELEEKSVRSFTGNVLFQLEVPDTVENAEIQDKLDGLPPINRGGITPQMHVGYFLQLFFSVPALALLFMDPVTPVTEGGMGVGSGAF
eukprot:TRINITY_DN114846_c0_g1_i1.p1 TRINITY_DN114846_c0_g1~~TRINITY_DN114846_c0_g1_i1.p1  ORF type:complete len:254 (+),score=40.41 TRINITY_DN114846_c0_g1_i1:43-762(+)